MTHDDDGSGSVDGGADAQVIHGGALDAPAQQHVTDALMYIAAVEEQVPPAYRLTVLESVLALRRGQATSEAAGGPDSREARPSRPAVAPARGASQDDMVIDLERYAHALAGPGRLLAKALITLEIVATQMGVDWMTPSEIERFLVDRARATHVYRTNVSNALRGARGLVDRRRRGRAYEYRITEAGRVVVDREVAILGPGPLD